MDDIVGRLRSFAEAHRDTHQMFIANQFAEAADEIQRLRLENRRAHLDLMVAYSEIAGMYEDVANLRDETQTLTKPSENRSEQAIAEADFNTGLFETQLSHEGKQKVQKQRRSAHAFYHNAMCSEPGCTIDIEMQKPQ